MARMRERPAGRSLSNILFFTAAIGIINQISHAEPVVVSGGPENDYESWIMRMPDNRLMIIFCRNPDWQSGDLNVTFSNDNGSSWSAAAPIITDAGDQATLSFVQLPDDTIRLWYASNESGAYGIYTAYSFTGTAWTKQGLINLGWDPAVMHYDPTVIVEPDSSLTMSYRGPDGAYVAHCPRGGSWDTLRTRVAIGGYRPRIMKHDNGTYLYAYHRKSGPGQYDYDIFVRTSTDRINWSDSVRLTDNLNSHDPFPNQTPDGAYLVYYAKSVPVYNLYRRRSYNTIDWEGEEMITSDPTNNTQPHFFIETNEIYLVWAHAVTFPDDHDVYFERFPYTTVEETELNPIANSSISIDLAPDPCKDQIKFNLDSKQNEEIQISIYNIQGQIINIPYHKKVSGTISFLFNTSALPNGAYFVKVKYQDGSILEKFIVVH